MKHHSCQYVCANHESAAAAESNEKVKKVRTITFEETMVHFYVQCRCCFGISYKDLIMIQASYITHNLIFTFFIIIASSFLILAI